MGNCGSAPSAAVTAHEDVDRIKTHKAIDAELLHQSKQDEGKIKLLLLGAGESGKSTIFKQMKIIYGNQYTDTERRTHTSTIYSNIISAMKILLDQVALRKLNDEVQAQEALALLRSINDQEIINSRVGEAIKALWNDPTIQSIWAVRNQFQITESLQYYAQRIDEIRQPDYLPSTDDIIYSRVRTTGIVTERYLIEGNMFEMYDVGGQRNERRKWIHCFEGVTAVIFVVALSEYDQVLFEDPSKNRMVEALELFDSICNNIYFLDASMILFLNKKDLFAEKIRRKHIRDTDAFSDYSGNEGDYEAGVQYFVDKFLSRNKNHNNFIYHHVTCATDTKNVEVVFNACKDIVLRKTIHAGKFSLE